MYPCIRILLLFSDAEINIAPPGTHYIITEDNIQIDTEDGVTKLITE